MKIFFAASMSGSRKYIENYKMILREIENLGHEFLSKRPADLRVKVEAKHWVPDKVFKDQAKLVEKADLMIAEVTEPSWGTAFLMEYALKKNIPVLAMFYKNDYGKLSLMIKGHPDLYVAYYNRDNLKTVMRKNLESFEGFQNQKGKLIVLDGTNGSGKATQTKKLLAYFKKNKIKARHIAFPRYYSSFHGQTVGRFLKGEFGGLEEVNPHLSSLAYALDRLNAREEIIDWLKEGSMVIADRYVTSSLAHQGIKVSPRKRKEFIRWLYRMEYQEHRMPKENIVVYLYVPPEISDKLILQKAKKYRGKAKRDIEEGLIYQRKVVKMYLKLCGQYKHWVKIVCVDKKGKLFSVEEVHQKVLAALKKKEIIK